ncbi:MAG: M36 family metallopeptidase, partial [Nannocystis sp.]
MTPTRPVVAAALLALLAAPVRAQERPNLDLSRTGPLAAFTPAEGVLAVARDPGRGVPALMWTPRSEAPPRWMGAEAAARLQLGRHLSVYRASPAALAAARLLFIHDIGAGGVIVALRQTVAAVDVFHGDIKLLLARDDRRLIAISGSPHPAARAELARRFELAPAAAVVAALRDLHGADAGAPGLVAEASPSGGGGVVWRHFALARAAAPDSGGLQFEAPARVRPLYFPRGETLVPAQFVELQTALGGAHAVVQYVVGDDGAVLYRRDATAHEVYQYRVWADVDGDRRPTDGPTADFTPHPTGEPGKGPDGFVAPGLVAMNGFNTNPDGEADPWLPAGAIETKGNNVDAYVDHMSPDGLSLEDGEFRAQVTAPGIFDRVYDVEAEPLSSAEQSMAAITSLFYVTNWMHDWWYDSGFNEATGNAQELNFGRGGAEGDAMRAEAQDAALGGQRNNANMSTPADGASPRMQMYLWGGLETFAKFELMPEQLEFPIGTAAFSPANFDLTAPLVLLADGAGMSPTDGCEPPINDLAGKIALVDRGNCTFEVKVAGAQAAGAVGVLIADNVENVQPIAPGSDPDTENPTLPTQGTTMAAGAALKAALELGAQSAHMVGSASVERDGTIDNMIVAHEWGHYIHHRLVECGNRACMAESEGWGDFNAILMALRENDDLDGSFVLETYAGFDKSGYFGIRRIPYSVDPAHNALSFRHVSDGVALPNTHPIKAGGPNSEVHNAGEIWATMMWESYIALHKAHAADLEFAEVRRLMSDYVVAGMLLAPSSPTFLEQRDALLMAIAARSQDDFITVAAAFAKRGAGSCAVGPGKNSADFSGIEEAFDLAANALLLAVTVDDAGVSCDNDGIIDIGEVGRIVVTVYNGGVLPLPAGATVELVDPDASLVLPKGTKLSVPELAPLEKVELTLEVEIDPALASNKSVPLTLRLTASAGCEAAGDRVLPIEVHADLQPAATASDDVEAEPSVWTPDGGSAPMVWTRRPNLDGHVWHADDVGYQSDTRLVSPPLQVSMTVPLELRFEHRYDFERSEGVNWDGAVIEVSTDVGKNWVDISTLAPIAYSGVIASEKNPINTRSAFVGTNPSYPAHDTETLLLGNQLAGQTVHLRFRVGTDLAAGAPGWDIDNIAFTGLDNTPFPRWTVDAGACDAVDSSSSGGGESGGQAEEGSGTPPTTSGDGEGGPQEGSSGGSETGDTESEAAEDGGCGCAADKPGPPGLL